MAWFTPENFPKTNTTFFGKDGGLKLAERLELPLLGQIPIVQGIREGGDSGNPVAWDENSITGKVFAEIASNLIRESDARNAIWDPTKKSKSQPKIDG